MLQKRLEERTNFMRRASSQAITELPSLVPINQHFVTTLKGEPTFCFRHESRSKRGRELPNAINPEEMIEHARSD
jgi:hypothetical protein